MTSPRRRVLVAAVFALAVPLGLAACSSNDSGTTAATWTSASGGAACPTTPVNVVVSVDQWGDIVSALGGECAKVTTVLASSSVDPHDFEPSPAAAAPFATAH